MICPRCYREMKRYAIKWDEREEFRVLSEEYVFCPCCGLTVMVGEEDK